MLKNINNVEIFSEGTWNNHVITPKDLDDMIEAFNSTSAKVRPHLKLGHDKDQGLLQRDGLPAAGWVANLRRKGNKLVADFVDIPEKVFNLINNKAYRKVSAEIFSNIEILGQKFPKMLGAVALLGADTPGVQNLDDILAWYTSNKDFQTVNFANETKLDTITNSEFELKEESSMSDDKIEIDNQALAALQEENRKLQEQLVSQKSEYASLQSDVTALKERNDLFEKEIIASKQREKEATIAKYVTELESANLISPAMKAFVSEMFSEKSEFSVNDKKYDKFELFKEVMTLASEFTKVNFKETTHNESDTQADEVSKVIAFAKERGIDPDKEFSRAYREYSSNSKEA